MYLIVPDEALVHPPVLLLDRVDPEHGIVVADVFAVLHPADALDRVALVVALEAGRTSVVDHLLLRLNLHRQRSWMKKFFFVLLFVSWQSENFSGSDALKC